jgi:hypothetical protein
VCPKENQTLNLGGSTFSISSIPSLAGFLEHHKVSNKIHALLIIVLFLMVILQKINETN